MNNHYDVIIVGGGVIGSSIAFHLSKRGKKVLLVEKNQLATKASSAAAGMLGAQTELEKDSPLFRLARKSRAMFPKLSEELKELSGIDIELVQNGMIKIAETDEEMSLLKSLVPLQQKLGEVTEWVPTDELHAQEPALSEHIKGAMYIPNDGNVSAPSLSKAFALSAVALGTDIQEYTEVYDFIKEKDRVVGVQTLAGSIYADETIVAGGAWSEQLLKQADTQLNTYPVKGECFSVRVKASPITRTVFANGCYIVPKLGGRLVIGATERANTFDETVSLNGVSRLMERATKIIPELENAQWEKAWAGIRPQTGDGLPYLGRHPKWDGLSIATGHYRNGILLSPITGWQMAELVEGKEIDDHFRVERNSIRELRI
ncbi:glycine oxidase ThiO [Rossellomorea sp. BNER]|uniref:glycine oxidase ThiO n=1 Tax=Rossellomorea sp. BNER TaxID=2962031 RepID=UPI003AF2CAF2|nr:glycine oxidase ThiO [Rossellomorea sp. BNER]